MANVQDGEDFHHAWLIRQNGDRYEAVALNPPHLILTWSEVHRHMAAEDPEPVQVETHFVLQEGRSPQGHLIYREFIGGVAA